MGNTIQKIISQDSIIASLQDDLRRFEQKYNYHNKIAQQYYSNLQNTKQKILELQDSLGGN